MVLWSISSSLSDLTSPSILSKVSKVFGMLEFYGHFLMTYVELFPIQGQPLTLALFLYSATATVVLILASHKLVRINYNQLRQELKTCLKIETHSIWTVQG